MFAATQYQYSVPFQGDARKAFNIALTSLISLGFEIDRSTDWELHAIGPGMHSNQQPALLGVTELTLSINLSSITADAVLGGAATMKAFIYLFPPALILSLLIFFILLGMKMSWLIGLIVLPWFIIAPLMSKMIEGKTTQAVDRLVRGMAQSE